MIRYRDTNKNGEPLLYSDFIEKINKYIPKGIEPIVFNTQDFEQYTCSKFCIDKGFKHIIVIHSNDKIHLLQEFKESIFEKVQKLIHENEDFKVEIFRFTIKQFHAIQYTLFNYVKDYVNAEERFNILLSIERILVGFVTNKLTLAILVVSIIGGIYYNYSIAGIPLGTISAIELKAIFQALISGAISNFSTWTNTLAIITGIVILYFWGYIPLENIRNRISTFHFIYITLLYPVSATIKIVFSSLALYFYFLILHDLALNEDR